MTPPHNPSPSSSEKLDRKWASRRGHQLRTPLAAISGFADLGMTSESLSEVKGYLEIIQRNAGNLSSLIDGLLEETSSRVPSEHRSHSSSNS